jgi:AraC-like DNA-binding protein
VKKHGFFHTFFVHYFFFLYFCGMITLGEMQISGMLTMLMLSVMLMACVPSRSIRRGSFARARWMMAVGTGLIVLQFLLQYIFGFREMGVTQGVCCNLVFFTPATLLCGMAILYVQRQGRVALREWLTGGGICALAILLLIGVALLDGVPLREESHVLRMSEYVASVLYVMMQSYIFKYQYMTYIRLEQAVDEYYDRSRRDLFGWMGWSMKAMSVLAFFVPVVIFMEGAPLVGFSIAYFFAIAYSTISLYSYGISKDVERVEEAENINEKVTVKSEKQSSSASLSTIHSSLESWIANGHYREHNLTLGIVARQMGVPQRQLQEWLRQSEYGKLAGLVTTLRIEDAKRVLKEHPDWSTESVASYCGFSSREYFHRTFRQMTGMTPANYQ